MLERLPAGPPSLLFARLLDLALGPAIRRGDLEPLHGRHIAILVTDAGLRLHFTVDAEGFSSVPESGVPALSVSATLRDFTLLATRQEDPDTLFFHRRLLVEGDTELALVAKNALDSLDLDALPLMAPLRQAAIMFREHARGPVSG